MPMKRFRRLMSLLLFTLFFVPATSAFPMLPAMPVFSPAVARASSVSGLIFPARGTVNAAGVNLRRSPRSGAERMAKLKENTAVTVTGEAVDDAGTLWYAVSSAGKTGYIQAEYLSVADEARILAAEASGEAVMMRLTVSAECKDTGGLGKTWTHLFEINGLKTSGKGLILTLAPDVPFSLFVRSKSKSARVQAAGEDQTLYTPNAAEIANGFTVVRSVTAVNKNGREAVWTVTFTFEPVGAHR